MSTTSESGAAPSALSLTVRPDGVAVVTYDVPGAAVNTLNASFAADFERIFGQVGSDPKIKAAILVSGKTDTFIAGADIEMLQSMHTAGEAEAMVRSGHRAILKLSLIHI